MDFKGFKKTHEDQDVATMSHPSGHSVRIVKALLSDDHKKRLSELPIHNMAEGGDVKKDANLPQDTDELPFVDLPVADPNNQQSVNGSLPAGDATPPGSEPLPPEPVGEPAPLPLANNANNAAPSMTPVNPLNPITGQPSSLVGQFGAQPGLVLGEAAAAETKKNTEQTGKALADEAVSYNNQLQSQAQREQDITNAYLTQSKKAADDIKKGFIKPNHYMDSKGPVGKIATALGLLLGGYGAGLTHGNNMAQQFLQSQIERDLEGQKANLGAKENLLSALNHQYQNQQVAENMYRSIMMNSHANTLSEIAAKSGMNMASPQFLQAQQALVGPAQEFAIRSAKLHMQNEVENPGQGTTQGSPAQPGQWTPEMDQKVKQLRQFSAATGDKATVDDIDKRYVPGVGLANVPLDEKDREFLTKSKNLQSMFGEAQALLKQTGSGTLPYTQLHESAGNKSREIQLTMGDIANLSRFTGEENKIYKQDVPDLAGTHFTNTDKAKLDSLEDSHQRNAENFYKLKGLPPPPERRVNIVGPDGKPYTVPASKASHLPHGWKVQ